MEIGEDIEERLWVELLVVVAHHVQDGEHDVEGVEHVEGDQEVVEADLLLDLSKQLTFTSRFLYFISSNLPKENEDR